MNIYIYLYIYIVNIYYNLYFKAKRELGGACVPPICTVALLCWSRVFVRSILLTNFLRSPISCVASPVMEGNFTLR